MKTICGRKNFPATDSVCVAGNKSAQNILCRNSSPGSSLPARLYTASSHFPDDACRYFISQFIPLELYRLDARLGLRADVPDALL